MENNHHSMMKNMMILDDGNNNAIHCESINTVSKSVTNGMDVDSKNGNNNGADDDNINVNSDTSLSRECLRKSISKINEKYIDNKYNNDRDSKYNSIDSKESDTKDKCKKNANDMNKKPQYCYCRLPEDEGTV